jgi:hypothetical protein
VEVDQPCTNPTPRPPGLIISIRRPIPDAHDLFFKRG